MKKISLTIKPTNNCNMRCRHCYHSEIGFDTKILAFNKIEKLLKQLSVQYDEIDILLHGGEPTLCGPEYVKNLFELQKVISEETNTKFINTLQTNGLAINDEWIEIFKTYSINLGISFDGPHNSILREYTEKVYNTLKELQKNNITFKILCVETSLTIDSLKETYEWFKKEKLSYKILPIFLSGNAKNNTNMILEPEDYALKVINLYRIWLKDKTCNINMKTFEAYLKLFSPYEETGVERTDCLYKRIAINSDGEIYPCGRPYDDSYRLGNVDDGKTPIEYFDTLGYSRLVKNMNIKREKCKILCEHYSVCLGGCASDAIIDGSITNVGGYFCIMAKITFDNLKIINKIVYNDYINNNTNDYNPAVVKIINNNLSKKNI